MNLVKKIYIEYGFTKIENVLMAGNPTFIGRKRELEQLSRLLNKPTASLVVVKGRRRIGKSRLIQEFGKSMKMFTFSGLAPTEKMTLKEQLHEFGWQLGKALGQPAFKDDNWNDLFLRLAHNTREGRVLILLDEISWMGSEDPNFLGKLKNAWDLEFKNNPNLILVLCGSVSAWIEKNIVSHTGFLGRISLNLNLEELPLSDCNKFWPTSQRISSFEKFKVLSVTGGVPKYLEEINYKISAEENIKNLCFEPSGLLFKEFEQIFSDIFLNRSAAYKKIVESLAAGKLAPDEIYKKLGTNKSGVISEYLDDLVKSGFLYRDFTWSLKNGKRSKLSRYRICDNYLRFYLKNIEPYKDRIERGDFLTGVANTLSSWESIMGLQFENLVVNNRKRIKEIIDIQPHEVVYDNPFFQRKTKLQMGCQIDYLIQTKFNTLYICEIKFSKKPIPIDIIQEIEKKIRRLQTPKYFTCRPVLIHVNGVDEKVKESDYFSKIIDFSECLIG